MRHKIYFAVGGTGGHMIPALKLKRQLEESCDVCFVGVGLGAKEEGMVSISGSPLIMKKPLNSLLSISRGVKEALALLKKDRPKLVIGFGSYHSFPVIAAAKMLGIPYILYEPNQIAGRVNRLFSKGALFTAQAFEFGEKTVTGKSHVIAPLIHNKKVDKEVARRYFGLRGAEDVLLVFGGSQGAASLNEALLDWAHKTRKKLQVIHITGKGGPVKALQKAYESQGLAACVKEYEESMDMAWSLASFAVVRAGANTIFEMLEYEVPALLVPYPFDKDGHQKSNAKWMVTRVGGGLYLDNSELSFTELEAKIDELQEAASDFVFCMKSYKRKRNPQDFSKLILEACER